MRAGYDYRQAVFATDQSKLVKARALPPESKDSGGGVSAGMQFLLKNFVKNTKIFVGI